MSPYFDFAAGGIIPFAKPRGITSFSALNSVKKNLRQEADKPGAGKRIKIGHTGTLDSFADGLLVVLTGKMTRLAPYITSLPKRYKALVRFGFQTDTLDPSGTPVFQAGLPDGESILSLFPEFTGKILQRPPEYSALKSGGKRLSDLVREGASVEAKPREVSIYSLSAETFFLPDGTSFLPARASEFQGKEVAAAVIDVFCSKGTYIRALARDIALSAGSAGFLYALRRYSVGPFTLDRAAGAGSLPPFESFVCPGLFSDNPFQSGNGEIIFPREGESVGFREPSTVLPSATGFSPDIAEKCGFRLLFLKETFFHDFCSGKPVSKDWFYPAGEDSKLDVYRQPESKRAVFCGNIFAGIVSVDDSRLSYDFVACRG